MNLSFQVKMGQQLTMTPQLQQAIRLLQLSTLDLQHEVQEALVSNPMLEADDGRTDDTPELSDGQEPLVDLNDVSAESGTQEQVESQEGSMGDFITNSSWADVHSNSANNSSDYFDPFAKSFSVDSLRDHLEWQLDMLSMSDRDRLIGLEIIEAVNPAGYLTCSLDDLFADLQLHLDDLEIEEVKVLQHRIQQFDPVGCCSSDLQECLLVQLQQLSVSTPHIDNAKKLILHHLKSLGTRDYAKIMRKAGLDEVQLRGALGLIQSFNPKPGSIIDKTDVEYVVPDVSVRKIKDSWVVELNSDSLPKLRINTSYASMIKRANESRDNVFMKNHLQEARWFLHSLKNRNETLMKVAEQIISFQKDFLEKGEEAMKPLILSDIADTIGLHESTISRVTTNKYINTPRGVYELKYFFSSHVSTTGGGECSSTAIRAHIRKLITEETPKKPLSDNKIANILGQEGIKVARRTIAKYRESMNIPPSNERKELVFE